MLKGIGRKLAALGALGAVMIAVQACFPVLFLIVVLVNVSIVGLAPLSPDAKPRVKTEIPVTIDGSIGGLDGTFDIDVGTYGTITGTAQIKGQKSARLKAKDDAQANAIVEAIVLEQTGVEIDVTKSKTVFKGSQTTGGVEKRYKLSIKWKGEVATGPETGKRVKGKIKTKGSFE